MRRLEIYLTHPASGLFERALQKLPLDLPYYHAGGGIQRFQTQSNQSEVDRVFYIHYETKETKELITKALIEACAQYRTQPILMEHNVTELKLSQKEQ